VLPKPLRVRANSLRTDPSTSIVPNETRFQTIDMPLG
jgi:hypothetical protein